VQAPSATSLNNVGAGILACPTQVWGFGPGFGVLEMPREIITLQCTDCKNKNYSTTKNKKTTTERLEMNKFCRKCRKHTGHKEIK
jgi:large subunit ribosomal protein L33